MSSTHATDRTPLKRRLLLGAMATVLTGVIAFVAAEVFLRVVPVPGVTFQSFYYDSLTGGHFYPGTRLIYQGASGGRVTRNVNSWGFLDREHAPNPAAGVYRVGFFGDSYTEARQVELDDTFFRRVEVLLNGMPVGRLRNAAGDRVTNVETLAFGVGGRSTLQSYLECTRWLEPAGIDLVVYVFSENDPGDQIREVTGVDGVPYAVPDGDSFAIDAAFRHRFARKEGRVHRAWQYVKAHSLVLSTLEQRLRLLRRHGVTMQREEGVAGREAGMRVTAPSTWRSDSLVSVAEHLAESVITRWRGEVEEAGREFVVLRIPRESQIRRPLAQQDAWAPWLHRHCDVSATRLVDPTDVFLSRMADNQTMYGDHLTADGHRAFADAFVAAFRNAYLR